MMAVTFKNRLKMVIGESKYTPWANRHGLSPVNVKAWLEGTEPYGKSYSDLAEKTGIPEEWWRSGEGPPPAPIMPTRSSESVRAHTADAVLAGYSVNGLPDTPDLVFVNLYDVRASGGHGAWNENERIVARLAFTRSWVRNELKAHPDLLSLIYVDGDSMDPTLKSGDIILVNLEDNTLRTDGIYVFMLNSHLMVKNLQRLPGQRVRVISDNPKFPTIEIEDDFDDADQHIIGRVVWVGRKL